MTSRPSFAAGRSDLPGATPSLDTRAGELRQSFERNRDPMIAAQRADLAKTEAERRASQMVKHDQPKPVQRPSPALAHGPDAASFNARWQGERDAANREARKAAFKAQRIEQSKPRTVKRERSS
jgi:hypothetical protein